MKKSSLLLLVLIALTWVGCEPTVQTTITIEPSSLTLLEGDVDTLTAVVTPQGEVAVMWTSNNPEVATVDTNGVVTAIAEGTATIAASIADVEPALCEVTVAKIASSFPRKHLIEHFTGDQCGYCPGGMFSITEYVQRQNTPCIWVSHHYGYNNDEYTISESKKIGAACGVNGAPNMAFNRTKIRGTTIAFNPGYLSEMGIDETIASKCENEAEASVKINHTYDATTQKLNVTVSGFVGNKETTEYLLSVLVKENGLIGKQSDYNGYSWKSAGFKEFLHPCVARDLISTNPLGDTINVEKQRYSKSFTYTLPAHFIPENCCVVAYITPLSKKPIINAEETPLVAGTSGGKEYWPFGITENQAPNNATKLSFTEYKLNKLTDNKLTVELIASSSTRSDVYGPVKLKVYLDFNTSSSSIPAGTYTITEGNEANAFTAGSVDLATQTFAGSRMGYYRSADLESMCHMWRIMSGSVIVNEDGSIVAEGQLDNGKNFKITYTLPTAVEE